jgi:hypothetical protein
MAKNKRATLLGANDWEGLYIDGKLVVEAHRIGGPNRFYFMEIAEKYNLKRKDFQVKDLEDSDRDSVEERGSMPEFITDFEHDY